MARTGACFTSIQEEGRWVQGMQGTKKRKRIGEGWLVECVSMGKGARERREGTISKCEIFQDVTKHLVSPKA